MRPEEKTFVVLFVKNEITEFVEKHKIIEIPKKYPEGLNKKCGVFVTLTNGGKLRGCTGFLGTKRKIIENLRDAAIESCLDSRFSPVGPDELPHLEFEVSILTEPKAVEAKSPEDLLEKITPNKDGIIIERDGCSGLFLPQVWDELPEKEEFLMHLCFKAGLGADDWKNGAVIYKFYAEIIEGKIRK